MVWDHEVGGSSPPTPTTKLVQGSENWRGIACIDDIELRSVRMFGNDVSRMLGGGFKDV